MFRRVRHLPIRQIRFGYIVCFEQKDIRISAKKQDNGVRAGVISAVVSAVLSVALTYGLVARPAEQSSDKALALAQQDRREEQAFHGALSAREDAQHDVAVLQRQSGYPSAREVMLKADALLIRGDGVFDAYPPRYGPALAAYMRVRTLVASFENYLPSHATCDRCKQITSPLGARESLALRPSQVVDTRLSSGKTDVHAIGSVLQGATSKAAETTPVPREPTRTPAYGPTP